MGIVLVRRDSMYKLKVIFHIDEMEKWDLVLKNAKNFYEGNNNSDIKILANGDAVEAYLKESEFEAKFHMLIGADVEFLACENALNKCDIVGRDLLSYVKVVPVGVIELVNKQDEGYRYIKP